MRWRGIAVFSENFKDIVELACRKRYPGNNREEKTRGIGKGRGRGERGEGRGERGEGP
jgi:hypothetical protein